MTGVGMRATSRCRRQNTSLFLTGISRDTTTVDQLDEAEEEFLRSLQKHKQNEDEDIFADPPVKYYEPNDIKIKLYLRECEKLKVIPVSAYLKHPIQNVLKLKHYNMGPNGARALAAALLLDTAIISLDIEGNSITSVGLASITEALVDNTHITYLNIADNKLEGRGAKLIGAMMAHNHTMEVLDVSRNGFRDSDADIFAKIMTDNRTLKELVLAGNNFEEHAGTVFGHALASNDILERLDLSWNHIRKTGAADFAQGIKENVGLKMLNVSFNGFGTEGTAYMGQALSTNRTLLELDMSKNRITNIDIKIFTKQMAQNDTLQILRLGGNLMDGLGAMEVLRTVMGLETSAIQVLDFGTMCVDQCFLIVLKQLLEAKDVQVIHGRIQNVYLDRDMMPVPENADQALTEYSGTTPGISEIDNSEKGRTYVLENSDKVGDEDGDVKDSYLQETEKIEGDYEPQANDDETEGQVIESNKETQESAYGNNEPNELLAENNETVNEDSGKDGEKCDENTNDKNSSAEQIDEDEEFDEKKSEKTASGDVANDDDADFDEKKLDDEVEAVTGKAEEESQRALVDDKGSAGTLTPDI